MPPVNEAALEGPRFEAHAESSASASRGIAAAAPPVECSIHYELDEIEFDWRAFEQYADCTPFQCFEWLSAWRRTIGAQRPVKPIIVVGRDPERALAFIMPLAIEGAFIRRLTWLGGDLADYNAPLLAPEFSFRIAPHQFRAMWARILRLIGARGHRYDLVDLCKMPEAIGAQRNPFRDLPVTLHASGAYFTYLGDDWAEFYAAKRSAATRRRDRSRRRRLAGHGEVRHVTPQTRADIAASLSTLMAQKARSLARRGVPNLFDRPGYRDFYLDLGTSERARDLVHVSRIDVGAKPVAVNFGLIFRGCYYHVLASYDGGELARLRPGVAHLHCLMAHAIRLGLRKFDFTIGDEPYKREWCDEELKLYDHRSARTLRGWLFVPVMRLRARMKRAIKQSPVLWSSIKRLRARLGLMRTRIWQAAEKRIVIPEAERRNDEAGPSHGRD